MKIQTILLFMLVSQTAFAQNIKTKKPTPKENFSIVGNWKGIKEAVGIDFNIKKDKSCIYTVSSKNYVGYVDTSKSLTQKELTWANKKIKEQFDSIFKVHDKALILYITAEGKKDEMNFVMFTIGLKLYAFAGGQSFYELQKD